ncbi:guanine nucleotide exchange factor VAV3-like isoform X3 [Biomphalaria glabrata]|uniref:Guanine nucleotide exchange factor VAV3-like isoform X3 n=1 Tax=Biomphalaria glabrata TaxID=6526 RepID=A0A9W3BG31_BIOGL|nr:guanine nucleotide exchange factor VAV3-like isoform X3 [Biomphalaria glabrata]
MMAADEWRNCVDWLVRCQILPPDHKATKHDATAFDLAQALRDGVLLCHLLNTLQPGCLDMKDFSSRPQMSQFLCMKNIRTFLQTCSTVFGLNPHDLFKPNDLFDVKDFKKVLDTLSQLSKSELAQRKFWGFLNHCEPHRQPDGYYNELEMYAVGFPPDSKHEDTDEDGDIYGNLHDLAIVNDLEDQEEIYDTVYQEDDDKIYDDLLKHRKSSASQPFGEPITKRDHCIKELMETEKNYNTALNMIIDHFIKPLYNVLPSADREIIFAHIQKLSEVHGELYEKLLKAIIASPPRLAEVFIQFKTKLLIYGDYCSNLPKAQEKIDKICENEQLRLKVQECERRANEGKFRLRDLLHVPMQRVLKYHLLMRELIKNTDKSSIEREGLERALEAMQDLSLYVNEVKRDHESLILIEDIQNSINDLKMPPNTTLKDYGRFQKDGELKVLSHSDTRQRNRLDASGHTEKRHIFLFDKVMLMCKAKGDTYSFKDAIVLGEFRIDDSPSIPEKKNEKNVQRPWSFPFIMVKQDKANAFTFFAKTADARDKWKEAVNMALDNSNPSAGRNYIMQTFDTPRECDVCGKLLRGIFYQGYICSDTKKVVHKECIGKSTQPPQRPPRTVPIIAVKAVVETAYRGQPPPPGNFRPALYLSKNEEIDIISKPDSTWWKGKSSMGEEGYFLSNCVKEKRALKLTGQASGSSFNQNGGSLKSTRESPQEQDSGCVPALPKKREPKGFPSQLWYVGEMERQGAQQALDPLPDGTFLIRVTNNPARAGELSLSIKYANAVRHIKVNRTHDGQFYLAELRYFGSVQELVEFYQSTELADSFPDVCTTLKYPYKRVASGPKVLGYAVAIYDYAATSTSQVTLQVNDRIAILSKTGQDKGWWKGENLRTNRIGYFPLAYVQDEEEQT